MEEQKQWLESVEKFRKDINAIIICPSCKLGYLTVTDIPFDNSNLFKGGERFIKCPVCGNFKIVLYRNPPENWNPKELDQ